MADSTGGDRPRDESDALYDLWAAIVSVSSRGYIEERVLKKELLFEMGSVENGLKTRLSRHTPRNWIERIRDGSAFTRWSAPVKRTLAEANLVVEGFLTLEESWAVFSSLVRSMANDDLPVPLILGRVVASVLLACRSEEAGQWMVEEIPADFRLAPMSANAPAESEGRVEYPIWRPTPEEFERVVATEVGGSILIPVASEGPAPGFCWHVFRQWKREEAEVIARHVGPMFELSSDRGLPWTICFVIDFHYALCSADVCQHGLRPTSVQEALGRAFPGCHFEGITDQEEDED